MLAIIKKYISTHYGMLADSGRTSKTKIVYAILIVILLALSAGPENKRQHKFQPGFILPITELIPF